MHIMPDLETMGNKSNAAIIAIGAVAFDANGVHDRFYSQCSLESSVQLGLKMDAGTVIWWLKQSDQARAAFADNDKAQAIQLSLIEFVQFYKKNNGGAVWGNGATFDNVILTTAFDLALIPKPWKFWDDKCYRTIKDTFKDVKLIRTGVHHNAVDDAESQALHLIDIAKKHNLPL